MKIILTTGHELLIDDEDYHLIADHTWYLIWSYRGKELHKRKAVRAFINGRNVRIHRLIMDAKPGQIVDHKDGDPLNNQRSNLRFCTVAENSRNCARNLTNKTGLKGVHKHPFGKYQARICVDRKEMSLGYFDTPEAAHEAYKAAAIKYHGEFARFE